MQIDYICGDLSASPKAAPTLIRDANSFQIDAHARAALENIFFFQLRNGFISIFRVLVFTSVAAAECGKCISRFN
jgi:hypothetical protein